MSVSFSSTLRCNDDKSFLRLPASSNLANTVFIWLSVPLSELFFVQSFSPGLRSGITAIISVSSIVDILGKISGLKCSTNLFYVGVARLHLRHNWRTLFLLLAQFCACISDLKQASNVFQFSITANEKKKLHEHLSADKLTGATEMPALLMNFPDNTSYFNLLCAFVNECYISTLCCTGNNAFYILSIFFKNSNRENCVPCVYDSKLFEPCFFLTFCK